MKNSEKPVSPPVKDGKGTPESPALTLDAVRKMLKIDLNCCLLMLQGMHDDPDTFEALAIHIHGKYMNQRHKEELEKQTKIAS